MTIYTSCWNSQKGIYYYTTYNRRQITAVNMHKVNLDAQQLTTYPMLDDEEFYEQN
ncbi:linear amide C-N hydrolase [Faecalibacillus intestinalis]|uniref:linear amide C-N hydrolase n=1 Tax=Faecalibacillus intestinalis TaxID=1982626 RepID=UPI003FD7F816